jgi:hypothetical protein
MREEVLRTSIFLQVFTISRRRRCLVTDEIYSKECHAHSITPHGWVYQSLRQFRLGKISNGIRSQIDARIDIPILQPLSPASQNTESSYVHNIRF